MSEFQVAIIIPAYNEEARIATVLRAAMTTRIPNKQVVVVSDGSTDKTAQVAQGFPGVLVVDLDYNVGKGGAMVAGVKATDAPIVAFVDADLTGLRPEHIEAIVRPIARGDCEMCIGVFRGGKFWSDAAQRVAPYISGQRAMTRTLFEGIPHLSELRMGVEISLEMCAKRQRAKTQRVVLRGVSNFHKEKKLGLMKGTAARGKMYSEILRAVMRERRREHQMRIRGSGSFWTKELLKPMPRRPRKPMRDRKKRRDGWR